MSWELVHKIQAYGDVCEMPRITCDADEVIKQLKQFDDNWKKFNPHKQHILRDGLSVTSLGGELDGPDLDSLWDLWERTGISYTESDFNVLTDVYHKCPEVQKLIDPWKPWLARCHFLRLPQGGHFPPHLDGGTHDTPSVFRIIVPIQNCQPPNFFMMIKSGVEFEAIPFKYGMSTYVNTMKRHTLFNTNSKDSIMLIMNIQYTEDSFAKFREEVY